MREMKRAASGKAQVVMLAIYKNCLDLAREYHLAVLVFYRNCNEAIKPERVHSL